MPPQWRSPARRTSSRSPDGQSASPSDRPLVFPGTRSCHALLPRLRIGLIAVVSVSRSKFATHPLKCAHQGRNPRLLVVSNRSLRHPVQCSTLSYTEQAPLGSASERGQLLRGRRAGPGQRRGRGHRLWGTYMATLTIRLDDEFDSDLRQYLARTGRSSKSEFARDALKRQLAIARFKDIRSRVAPFAEAQGWLTMKISSKTSPDPLSKTLSQSPA